MKTATYIIIISLGFVLTAFTNVSSTKPDTNFVTSDSIPPMNKQIINYVNSKMGKKVATGECWDVAAEALKAVNAKWDMQYKFGREINYKKESVYPGDIIQFENVLLNYEKDGKKYIEKMAHHTAIVYEVKDSNNFMIAHQNSGYTGKKVGVSPLDLTSLTKGKFKIYRAEK